MIISATDSLCSTMWKSDSKNQVKKWTMKMYYMTIIFVVVGMLVLCSVCEYRALAQCTTTERTKTKEFFCLNQKNESICYAYAYDCCNSVIYYFVASSHTPPPSTLCRSPHSAALLFIIHAHFAFVSRAQRHITRTEKILSKHRVLCFGRIHLHCVPILRPACVWVCVWGVFGLRNNNKKEFSQPSNNNAIRWQLVKCVWTSAQAR